MKIINFIKTNKLLLVILFIAGTLRMWNLNNVPPHLTPDEAALGYNAYSILKTGRDEHRKFMPLVFRSFGDYKPGFYIYADIPFVALFGLNEWSVRLPSAVAGIVTVYLIFLIVGKFFPEQKYLAFTSAVVAATNPWLIYFSRGAWEANLSLMLTLFGIYFFLKSLKQSHHLLYSALFFGLTLLTYQGAKLSTAIVVLLLVLVYWKDFWKMSKRHLYFAVVLGALISLPILLSFKGQTGRLAVFSIFNATRPDSYLNQMLIQNNEVRYDINYYISHSDLYDTFRGIMGRWFNHFSGRFLFFEGDWPNPRHSSPYQGMLLLSDLLFLLNGLTILIKRGLTKENVFVLSWLVIACLPAILSRDQVHAVRSLGMSIPLIIISGMGLNYLINNLNKLKYLFVAFYFLAFIYFIDSYFVHLPKQYSKLWEYGYKQIVETVYPIKDNYQRIVVQQSFAQPYIYFLFYSKYDPYSWQNGASYIESEFKGDVGYVTKLNNIEFGAIDWSRNRGDKGSLFVADTLRIPIGDSVNENEFKLIKEIKYLDGLNTAFRIVEIKK